MRDAIAAVGLVGASLAITLAWSGESWAQTKIARVGVLTFGQAMTGEQAKQWWEPFRRSTGTSASITQ